MAFLWWINYFKYFVSLLQNKLLEIIKKKVVESKPQTFARRMSQLPFPQESHIYNHLLLMTSAVVPKAFASLLTSFTMALAVYGTVSLPIITCSNLRISKRVKKIICPGAQDKWDFRPDKHIFSHNARQAIKKFSASLFFLEYVHLVFMDVID